MKRNGMERFEALLEPELVARAHIARNGGDAEGYMEGNFAKFVRSCIIRRVLELERRPKNKWAQDSQDEAKSKAFFSGSASMRIRKILEAKPDLGRVKAGRS